MSATLNAVRRTLAARLRDAGIETPELDARLLTAFVTGLDLTALITHGARPVTPDQADRLDSLAQHRIAGEPIARIVSAKQFWGLDLHLSRETLVPRPDTETVVRAALDHIGKAKDAPLRIADLGTGSGAILLALLSELPQTVGVATDISVDALCVARGNARRLGLASRFHAVVCDYAAALSGSFDLVVSNPPYVRSDDIAALAIEVRDHDPHRALDGGPDGLAAYRTIALQTPPLLRPGGMLIVEVGHGQSGDVAALFAAAGLVVDKSPAADLSGIPRAVIGQRLPR